MTTTHNKTKKVKQLVGKSLKLSGFHPKRITGKGMRPYKKQPSKKEVLTFIEKRLPEIVAEEGNTDG